MNSSSINALTRGLDGLAVKIKRPLSSNSRIVKITSESNNKRRFGLNMEDIGGATGKNERVRAVQLSLGATCGRKYKQPEYWRHERRNQFRNKDDTQDR